jgi:Zinc dependent phospholipase C
VTRIALSHLFRSLLLLALILIPSSGAPYSVQTHEQIVDLAWKQSIRPILLKHYPNLTQAQLDEAHAYAYGGSAIQDIGYYPYGNAFFSNVTHYVRSGDFILSLLHNAQNANDLAFAIGALSHYIGDNFGHSAAVNHAVPVEFPKLQKKYGNSVNYAQGPHPHVQTEFAFDIDQLSRNRFAPAGYLSHVGLEIPMPLLRTAFFEIYGLNLTAIIGHHERAVRIYRHSVRSFIPNIAAAETLLHKNSFPRDTSGDDYDTVRTQLLQAATENNWKAYQHTPGFAIHMYAGLIFILPKVGPLSMLAIKGPVTQTEELYIHSLARTIEAFHDVLADYDNIDNRVVNRDLDTGQVVKPGGYPLTDQTYARLLNALVTQNAQNPNAVIPYELQQDILDYYSNPDAPITTKKDPKQWATVQSQLVTLASMKTTSHPAQALARTIGDD